MVQNIILQPHQKKVVDFILNPSNKSILLFHSLGSGKTISSLSMAKQLMQKYPTKHVLVITPVSLVSVFERESKRLHINPRIESYNLFLNKLKAKQYTICKNSILILDEVQNLNGESSITFKHLFDCSKKAFKIILLSATPVKNSPSELANQASFLINEKVSRGNIETVFSMPDTIRANTFKKLLKCKVSFYQKDKNNSDYPTTSEHVIKLEMPIQFYKEYYKVQENIKKDLPDMFKSVKDLTVFLNGIRRSVNTTHNVSPKIDWIINKIKNDISNNKKVMVYSNWLDAGINLLKNSLNDIGIKTSEITGKLTKAQKDFNVDQYNKGIVKVILLSSSGGEGISLKATRTVILLEPHWNTAKIKQVIGRAIRFKSHSSLPLKDRKVDIYHLLLEKPGILYTGRDLVPSADIILYKLSKSKEKLIKIMYKILEDISIEKDKTCK